MNIIRKQLNITGYQWKGIQVKRYYLREKDKLKPQKENLLNGKTIRPSLTICLLIISKEGIRDVISQMIKSPPCN
jgi:hypothetical protein